MKILQIPTQTVSEYRLFEHGKFKFTVCIR